MFDNPFADLELENQILASCVQNGAYLTELQKHIGSDDAFWHEQSKKAYQAILCGHPLTGLLEPSAPADDFLASVQRLIELHKQRGLSLMVQGMSRDLKAGKSADDIKALAQASLQGIGTDADQGRPCQSICEGFPDLLTEYRYKLARRRELGQLGINIHLKELNGLLGGLQPGIHVLAAAPGCGKTTLALQIAGQIARDTTHPVLFVSFEESTERVTLKALCQLRPDDLIYAEYSKACGDPDHLEAVMAKHGHEIKSLYVLEGRAGLSASQVKNHMLTALRDTGNRHGLIIIDYLQIWASIQSSGGRDFRHEVSSLLGELRRVSLELKIPVLVISSQSRSAYGKLSKNGTSSEAVHSSITDYLSTLKESGELEYTADSAMFLVPREKETGNRFAAPGSQLIKPLWLVLSKNRYGDTGAMPLEFNPARGTIFEPKTQGLPLGAL